MVSELANLDVEVMCCFICVDTRQNGRFGLIFFVFFCKISGRKKTTFYNSNINKPYLTI